ncbi:MAG: hypothetical protein COS99_02115 [Candidatus Omnitrophica bacterium CG07_land_8_20_14_0_80_42_15]|uniref:Uncharacterized protein n=1 Tax=Candidatus Aquitaenariimonas noxiae TaxID=1974741 RepID=A0A2J0KUL1_9BACT|nr:MAG: hypothetical protein COS99_02115 [Candidatus Omnitrophica bacterium CG07_land_8_20_14_0_80_42_15]
MRRSKVKNYIILFSFILPILSSNLVLTAEEEVVGDSRQEEVFGDNKQEEIAGDSKQQVASLIPEAITVPAIVDMSQRITLDLRNMEVVDALKYLALKSGMNIVTGKTVSGRVTFQLKDVPLQDVFDMVLLSNELAYEKRGDIFYVMTDKEYEGKFGERFSDARTVKIFRLRYAIPEKAFDLLDTLKSKVGRILVDQESGTVLIMDTAENIKKMEEALDILEKKPSVTVFNLKYANAKDVEEQLRVQLDDKKVGSIRADERSNQVIVQTLAERMGDVEKMIGALDRKTKEVLIDAKIVKIQVSDNLAEGLEWEGIFKNLNSAGAFVGSHPYDALYRTGQSFIDLYLHRQDIKDISGQTLEFADLPKAGTTSAWPGKVYFGVADKVEGVMQYLQTLGDTKLLSNPTLAVVNNQEARIHIGRREAYITTTTTSGQTTVTTAEEVTFIDVGIQLAVTPTINDDGFITMKVKPEVSSVVDILTTPSKNQIPIIDTSTAETTVMVKDGTTIIIGGLRGEEDTQAITRVPVLGALPLFGHLFSSQTKGKKKSELLVMITPHLITGERLTTGEYEPEQEQVKPDKEYDKFEPAEMKPGELKLKPYLD